MNHARCWYHARCHLLIRTAFEVGIGKILLIPQNSSSLNSTHFYRHCHAKPLKHRTWTLKPSSQQSHIRAHQSFPTAPGLCLSASPLSSGSSGLCSSHQGNPQVPPRDLLGLSASNNSPLKACPTRWHQQYTSIQTPLLFIKRIKNKLPKSQWLSNWAS